MEDDLTVAVVVEAQYPIRPPNHHQNHHRGNQIRQERLLILPYYLPSRAGSLEQKIMSPPASGAGAGV